MGLKRVMVKYSTNFWSFLTKSTTFMRFLILKLKNEIKIVKKNTCAAFNPKTRYGEIFDKLLVFFDQKYHFLEILDFKTQKRD